MPVTVIATSAPIQIVTVLPEVVLTSMPVFSHSLQHVTALSGWPAGRTPKAVATQGANVRGYIRRPSDYGPNNDGTWVDILSGHKTDAAGKITLTLDDNSTFDLKITITHPAISSGAKHLDRAGGRDYTTWAQAMSSIGAGQTLVVHASTGNWTDSAGHPIPNYVYDIDQNNTPLQTNKANVSVIANPADIAAGRRPLLMAGANNHARFLYDYANNCWQVDQNLSGGEVSYRSVQQFNGAAAPNHSYVAMYKSSHGGWMSCYSARRPAIPQAGASLDPSGLNMIRDTSYSGYTNNENFDTLMGPTISWESDGYYYIRLKPPVKQVMSDPNSSAPYPPSSWDGRVPVSADPRTQPILLTTGYRVGGRGGTGGFADSNAKGCVALAGSSSGWIFENIDFIGANCSVRMDDYSGPAPKFYGCTFKGGAHLDWYKQSVESGAEIYNNGSPFIFCRTFKDMTTDIIVEQCDIDGHNPPWGSWPEGKGYCGAYGMVHRKELIGVARVRFLISNSRICNFWIGQWNTNPNDYTGATKCHFRHNNIIMFGIDGGYVGESDGEHAYSRCFMASVMPLALTGDSRTNSTITKINCLTVNNECFIFGSNLGSFLEFKWADISRRSNTVVGVPLQTVGQHAASSISFERYYNNTMIGSSHSLPDNGHAGHGTGTGMTPGGRDGNNDGSTSRNNIGVLVPSPYAWPAGRDSAVAVYLTGHSYACDNNHLYRSGSYPGGGVAALAVLISSGLHDGQGSPATLQDLKNAGFESNGTEGDPGFAGGLPTWVTSNPYLTGGIYDKRRYLLSSGSPAAVRTQGNASLNGGIDYDIDGTQKVWSGSAWKGCMNPAWNANEIRVGICSPAPSAGLIGL